MTLQIQVLPYKVLKVSNKSTCQNLELIGMSVALLLDPSPNILSFSVPDFRQMNQMKRSSPMTSALLRRPTFEKKFLNILFTNKSSLETVLTHLWHIYETCVTKRGEKLMAKNFCRKKENIYFIIFLCLLIWRRAQSRCKHDDIEVNLNRERC